MAPRRRRSATAQEALGAVVRRLRRDQGMTQEALAFACDRSPHFISDVERAQYGMSIRTLFAIADALGTRPSDMLRETEDLMGLR